MVEEWVVLHTAQRALSFQVIVPSGASEWNSTGPSLALSCVSLLYEEYTGLCGKQSRFAPPPPLVQRVPAAMPSYTRVVPDLQVDCPQRV